MSSKLFEAKLTSQNLHEHLRRWKTPYLEQANNTAKEFQRKVKDNRKASITPDYHPTQPQNSNEIASPPVEKKSSKPGTEKTIMEQKCQNKLEPKMQEWRFSPEHGFKDFDELIKNYSEVFQKKQKVRKVLKDELIEDFRADERQIVEEIYNQLKDPKELTVSFEAIEIFFENCELFYYFYNIHPYRLQNILKQSAKQFEDRLNREEFFDFFLIDRPTVLQFKTESEKKVCNYSILSEQNWKKLKAIFDTLDTFGNEKICIKMFYQRIRSNPSCLSLLSSEAVAYPEIQRTYTLEKVLFDLQNKKEFLGKVDWQTIQDAITNFAHIENPTLDEIYKKNLQQAKITKNSNYFLLDPKALQIIKRIFNSCPKYCNTFAKTSFFSYELLEAGIMRPYLDHATRLQNSTKNTFLSLEEVIKKFSKEAPNYIDLDEMLQLISIKGFQNSKKLINLYDEIQTSSSEQSVEKKQMKKLSKVKSLEQLKKTTKRSKKKPVYQITKPKEFNLYHRQQMTIRQQKVQQMIREKEAADQIQLQKKFKANPIPVTLNPQRYQRYAKLLQKKKNSILNRLGMNREKDQVIIDYLKSNTKLFEPRKTKRHCSQEKETFIFQASPLPLHLSEELLPKIEAEKLERRNQIKASIINKYSQVCWKGLGDTSSFENEDSLLQKINEIQQKQKIEQIKPKQVPNFAQLHKKFEQQLEKRRINFQPTKIQQFKLSSPGKFKKLPNQPGTSPKPKHKFTSPLKTDYEVDIKSTKKYQDLVAYNKAKIAEKQLIVLEKQKQQEERLMKQKNFAKFMRKYLANCVGDSHYLRHNNLEKMKSHKDEVKRLERETRDQLAQIYTRVLQKPFLFETASLTRKPPSKQRPKKVHSKNQLQPQNYPFKDGLFQRQGEEFHPIESENLNQSF